MSGARIVLATFGSLGDLHPYLALARGLAARGHRPVVATSEMHRARVEGAGIEFHAVRPDVEDLGGLEKVMPLVHHPVRGAEYIVRVLFMPHLRASHADLDAAADGADLIVNHPLSYSGPLVAERRAIPWVSTVLSPMVFMSAHDPPVLPPAPWLLGLRALGPRAYGAIFGVLRLAVRGWGEPVRRLRAELGLAPAAGDPILEGQFSPRMTLAMYSRVLGEPQPDWPPGTRLTGFPAWDADECDDTAARERLERFLADGDPPIVFTLGSSAVMEAGSFYEQSLAAARALGHRAVLLVGRDAGNAVRADGDDVAIFDYLPHSAVFPHARAIVHQGGVGTLGQALAAGRPMLVVPYANDQPDNARRVERLGIARAVPRRRYDAGTAARALRELLGEEAFARRAAAIGETVRAEDGAGAACDAIETVLAGG